MTPEQWREIQALFEAATEIAPSDRDGFLAQACGSDAEMRKEVESLLSADEAPGILDGTAAQALGLEAKENEAGRVVGAFRLVRALGVGGTGEVFLAERADEQFEQRVAVKMLRSHIGSKQVLERFASERQILAHMEHEHIARLFDGGATDDGRPYFVMEYVDGTPIDEYCVRHDLGVSDRIALLCNVCAAVQYAHGRLVIHRDLKPDNIFVTAEGVVKLLDFGIAKVVDPGQMIAATDPRLLRLTPQYAAPEQVRGQPATVATDVYALGVVLYKLLTDRFPYRVDEVPLTKLAEAICSARPRPPSQVARVDPRFDASCTRAMAVRPEDRFETVGHLRDELAATVADDPGRRPRDRVLLACAASFLLGAALALAVSRWLL